MIPFPLQAGQFGRRRASFGNRDPNFANVELLLHFDGSNGSTTFTDNSSPAKTATVVGNAQLSTAQFKFGTASGLFDGVGDAITFPDSADWHWGSGNGTAELFVLPAVTTPATRGLVFGQLNAGGGQGSIGLAQQTTGVWRALIYNGVAFQTIDSGAIPASTWQHLALVKESTTFRFYVDGVQQGSFTIGNAGQINDSAETLAIGRGGAYTSETYNGYVDEFRWTKGIARYPGGTTFTPPAAPFPNS